MTATIPSTRRVVRGLRSAAPARATAGTGTASVPEAGDQPAGRRVGQLQAHAVAALVVADEGDEVGTLAADTVALQQLDHSMPAPLRRRNPRTRADQLRTQRHRDRLDRASGATAVGERQIAGQEPTGDTLAAHDV